MILFGSWDLGLANDIERMILDPLERHISADPSGIRSDRLGGYLGMGIHE